MDEHWDAPPPAPAHPPDDRLDSWKEIAAYLGRGIRTVQRWERDEGLPVHRLVHEKRGSVYARREELTAWWEHRRVGLPERPAGSVAAPVAPRLERVTRTSAATFWPALSSDGRLAAYTSDAGEDGRAPQIWVQQIGGAAVRLTNNPREYSHLSFSPDDTRIVFTAADGTGQHVFEMPALGGQPRLLQRHASCARYSPDGRWLAIVPHEPSGAVRIVARAGTRSDTIAPGLIDVSCIVWSPDSRALLVNGHSSFELETDWWVVPVDGRPPSNTGITRMLREDGFFGVPTTAAWLEESIVYSATREEAFHLYRQRLTTFTFQVDGPREQLTIGHEYVSYPAAGGGRLAFISNRRDGNLWSVAVDAESGVARGALDRLTRGPGVAGFLSVTRDGRTLAYFSTRLGPGGVFLRSLDTGEETATDGPPGGRGYPAISPLGDQLAYGTRATGDRTMRPIFIERLCDGTSRLLGDDCGGRPRQWIDERRLIIERFARFNAIALIDPFTGERRELLASAERSVKNPRVSPDGRWVAFDAARPGEPPSVLVAPLGDGVPIPESVWVVVERTASHPFWSADGRFLYYLPTGEHAPVRSLIVAARRVSAGSGRPEGEPIAVFASREMLLPAFFSGATPIATSDRMIFALDDFRGDVWLIEKGAA